MRTKKIQWIFFCRNVVVCVVPASSKQSCAIMPCRFFRLVRYKFNSSSDKSFRKKLFFHVFVITKLAIELVKFLKLTLLFQKKEERKKKKHTKLLIWDIRSVILGGKKTRQILVQSSFFFPHHLVCRTHSLVLRGSGLWELGGGITFLAPN